MKMLSAKAKSSGIMLVEVVAAVFIIAVLFAMLLPADGGPSKAKRINCANNLKRIGESFGAWSLVPDAKLQLNFG